MALTKEQIQTLKATLLTMKEDLEEKKSSQNETSIRGDSSNISKGIDNHLAETASDTEEQIMQQTFQQADEQRLNEINDSLKQIEEGKYGICVDTGEDISFERLEAVPYAKRTIQAQQTFEENHYNDISNEKKFEETMRDLADSDIIEQDQTMTTKRLKEEHDAF